MTVTPADLPDDLFDLERPALDRSLYFEVLPATAGGWPAVTGALVRLLERCSADGLWWATIDLGDDGRTYAFAHLGPDDGGQVWTEVSADFHLPKRDRLTARQHEDLVARGWELPLDEDGMQNFHRSYPACDLRAACCEVVSTLIDVYGFREDEVVRVIVEPFVVTGPPAAATPERPLAGLADVFAVTESACEEEFEEWMEDQTDARARVDWSESDDRALVVVVGYRGTYLEYPLALEDIVETLQELDAEVKALDERRLRATVGR